MDMKEFNYKRISQKDIPLDVVNLLVRVYEHRGISKSFFNEEHNELIDIHNSSKIQSTISSNRIEGIEINTKRSNSVLIDGQPPQNLEEEEIVGYKEVLDIVHDQHDSIKITPSNLLSFHQQMYSETTEEHAGKYKNEDNVIVETDEYGNKTVRFRPMPAFLVPDKVEELCTTFNANIFLPGVPSLILICEFILDFLCIHPFMDGNGRMSRLLTILLLYLDNHKVAKYISIDRIIEETKDVYYSSLQKSSYGWLEGNNDPYPFIRYMLTVILIAYRKFEEGIYNPLTNKTSSIDQVKEVFINTLGYLSKVQILDFCPNLGISGLEKVLRKLLEDNFIGKVGRGKSTRYRLIKRD
jgi:Fic family protein